MVAKNVQGSNKAAASHLERRHRRLGGADPVSSHAISRLFDQHAISRIARIALQGDSQPQRMRTIPLVRLGSGRSARAHFRFSRQAGSASEALRSLLFPGLHWPRCP